MKTIQQMLIELTKKSPISDEEIAVLVNKKACTVRRWRKGERNPSYCDSEFIRSFYEKKMGEKNV